MTGKYPIRKWLLFLLVIDATETILQGCLTLDEKLNKRFLDRVKFCIVMKYSCIVL